ENTIIVRDRAVRLEGTLHLAIQLVGICDLRNTAYRKLGSEIKRLAHGLIGQTVDGKLAKRLALPSDLADVVAGSIGRFKRAPEGICLFRTRQQLDGGSQSHNMKYITDRTPVQVCAKAGRVP